MSHFTAGQAGVAAVDKRDWEGGIAKLSQALKGARSPAWLMARSKAYIGIKDYKRALHDAELAYNVASSRGNRNSMIDAQYRRSVAYFRLGQYANADSCAFWSQRLAAGGSTSDPEVKQPKVDENGRATTTKEDVLEEMKALKNTENPTESKFGTQWNVAGAFRLQCLGAMVNLPEEDQARTVTVTMVPDVSDKIDFEETEAELAAAKTISPSEEKRAAGPPKELKVDFFQSDKSISVSIFAKNVPKDQFKVEYKSNKIRMAPIPNPGSKDDEDWLEILLWGKIDTAGSKHTVTPNKVELTLKKLGPGKWPTLRADPIADGTAGDDDAWGSGQNTQATAAGPEEPKKELAPETLKEKKADTPAKPEPAVSKPAGPPAYPTSSKSGPKDWDHLADNEEDDSKEDVNFFFKKLYSGATPEQQRAMMKSFVESNGTALSTDWNDVKNRKVETQPPDGVVEKKWE